MIYGDDYEKEPPNAKEIRDKFFETWNSNKGFEWKPRTHYRYNASLQSQKIVSAEEILEGYDDIAR